MKSSFEDRLTELAGAEGFAAGKQLLKKKMLSGGAWRNRNNRLCGRFISANGIVDTEVETGESPRGFCSCGKKEHAFCEHAVALVMYAGRFSQVLNMPVPGDEVPTYYGGLRQESFDRLAEAYISELPADDRKKFLEILDGFVARMESEIAKRSGEK